STATPLTPYPTVNRSIPRPELPVPDPSGRAPCGAIESHLWIALFCFSHNRPRVAALVIEVVARVQVTGHGALGRVAVAGNLYEQRADRSAEFGFENQVQYLAPLRLGSTLRR